MRDEVQRDFERSARALRDVVFPALQTSCPAFQGMEVEVLLDHHNPLQHDLDTIAGIDAYLRSPLALRTIAARVQYGYPYRTFTIRVARPQQALTELQKRLSQLASRESGALYPYWSVHAYLSLDGTRLSCAAIAKTSELYLWMVQQFANRDPRDLRWPFETRISHGQERFIIIPWDAYRASGNYFFEYADRSLMERTQKRQ